MATLFSSKKLVVYQWFKQRLVVLVACSANLIVLCLIVGASLIVLGQPYNGLRWNAATGHIAAVAAGSPAADAGLRASDQIVAIDGVPRAAALEAYVAHTAGETIFLTIGRDDETDDTADGGAGTDSVDLGSGNDTCTNVEASPC